MTRWRRAGLGAHPVARARLVEHVDRLVGELAVVDVLRRELGRRPERLRRVRDAVVLLVDLLQAPAGSRRCRRRDGSWTSIFWKRRASARSRSKVCLYSWNVVEPMQRSSPEASAGLSRFDASIERAGGRAGADDGVDLVDEEDGVRGLLHARDDALEPLLELAAELGAGEQRAHVERVDRRLLEDGGHLLLVDAQREPLDDGGLADARLADEERVVLAPPAEDLDRALDLGVAADERVDAALPRRAR